MKKLLTVTMVLVALSIGCAGASRHPADIAATYIVPADQGYQALEKSLIVMHDTCAALGDNCPPGLRPIVTNWNKIDDLNDKVSAQIDKVHKAWFDVAGLKTPQNEAELKKQLDIFNALMKDLAAFIPENK